MNVRMTTHQNLETPYQLIKVFADPAQIAFKFDLLGDSHGPSGL